jgi:hypothetical protein
MAGCPGQRNPGLCRSCIRMPTHVRVRTGSHTVAVATWPIPAVRQVVPVRPAARGRHRSRRAGVRTARGVGEVPMKHLHGWLVCLWLIVVASLPWRRTGPTPMVPSSSCRRWKWSMASSRMTWPASTRTGVGHGHRIASGSASGYRRGLSLRCCRRRKMHVMRCRRGPFPTASPRRSDDRLVTVAWQRAGQAAVPKRFAMVCRISASR